MLHARPGALFVVFLLTASLTVGPTLAAKTNPPIPLQVQAGTPLRLYLTKRVRFRPGQQVEAKLAAPVWAFDRTVIPVGTIVQGEVVQNQPVDRATRTMSILRGDFTPLQRCYIRFTTLASPGQPLRTLDTAPVLGLSSIYDPRGVPPRKAVNAVPPDNRSGRIKAFVRQQISSEADRGRNFLAAVRGPNKREWIQNFLWTKLPYHPQWYRSGTRFDAVLNQPLSFGTVPETVHLDGIGVTPSADITASIRFLSDLNSRDAKVGDPVKAVLAQPVFSADQQLLLPEGTLFEGKVTKARRARYFHRSGQLRFVFTKMDTPFSLASASERGSERIQAQLTGAESATAPVKVDDEGNVKTTDPKARFIRPVIAGFVASRAADNDLHRHVGTGTATGTAVGNYGGRSLGGFSGFGLLGTLTGLGPPALGAGFGYYGLACSVYSTVIARGKEVVLEKNSAMSIRFGAARKSQTEGCGDSHGAHDAKL